MSVAISATCSSLDLHEARWFAVYTRFKCEKRVCQELQRKGIHSYVPIQSIKRRYSKKVKTHHLPLISCYTFVKITQQEYVQVLDTDNVVDFVRFANRPIAIPDQEMDILKRVAMDAEALERIEPGKVDFAVGDAVEIVAGNLIGLTGTLLSQEGKKYVIVELEQLGYTLQLKVATQLLEKVPTQVRAAA